MQPAREFIQVLNPHCPRKFLFRPAKPMDWHSFRKSPRRRFKNSLRRALRKIACKRMNDRESPRRCRAPDFRESRDWAAAELSRLFDVELNRMSVACRQRGQELKRQAQLLRELPEFRPIVPIPRNHRIEAPQTLDHVIPGEQSQPVKSRCNNGLRRIREARQRYILRRAPDFGVVGPQGFERRQAEYEIADGTWPDQEATNQKACQLNHQL